MLSKLHIHQFSQMFNPKNAAQQHNKTSKSIWLWLSWCFWWYHQEPTEFDGCFFYFFSSLFWALWGFSSSFTPGKVQSLSQTCNKQNNFTSSLLVVAHWKHTKFKTRNLLFCFLVMFMFRGQPEVLFNSIVQHTHWCLTLYLDCNK